jgi:hypothetical protein
LVKLSTVKGTEPSTTNSYLKSLLIGGVIFLVVPNILFWIISQKVYLIRGVFVIEYFALACLYPYVPKRLFIILWILFTIYDLLFASTSLFFMDFFQMVDAATGLRHFSAIDLLKWTGIVIAICIVSWLVVRLLMTADKKLNFLRPKVILPVLVIVFLVDFFSGGNTIPLSPQFALIKLKINVVSAPSFSFLVNLKVSLESKRQWGISPVRSVAKEVFDPDDTTRRQLLILVESWGLLRDTGLESELTKPLYACASKKGLDVREGVTNYKYLTQIAEMREITGFFRTFSSVDSTFARQHSLFYEKRLQGYTVIGVHGYSGGFYDRTRWWPVLGVQHMFFAEQLSKLQLPFGGNPFFRGAEDTAIGKWIFQHAEEQGTEKQFYYWVTLNTHLPLVPRNDKLLQDFKERWKGHDDNVLQLSYQLSELFKILAKTIDGSAIPMHILIIGDHAPPFIDPAKRLDYDPLYVPFIELRPGRIGRG